MSNVAEDVKLFITTGLRASKLHNHRPESLEPFITTGLRASNTL
jgi:hypothetical protein